MPTPTIPTTACQGRNEGSTPTSVASSASSRPRTTRKSPPRSAIAAVAPLVGIAADHVVGIRSITDGAGKLTYRFEGCGTVADGDASMITYIEGKRCWVNKVVFGDATAKTASDVNRQWERIKEDERIEAAQAAADESGTAGPPRSALDGISTSMPARSWSSSARSRSTRWS